MDDSEIVVSARAGDKAAFSCLVEHYSKFLHQLVSYYIPPQDIPDVAQDIWLAVYRKLWQLEDASKFVPWLRKLTFYHCMNHVTRGPLRIETYLKPADWITVAEFLTDDRGTAELLERKELSREISQYLDQLPGQYRTILCLRYIKELSLAEISAVVNLPVSTVKWRLHQGRLLLRARLARLITERSTDAHA